MQVGLRSSFLGFSKLVSFLFNKLKKLFSFQYQVVKTLQQLQPKAQVLRKKKNMITHIMMIPNQILLLLILMTLPIKNLNCWLETWLVIWLVFSENLEQEQLPLHVLVYLPHPHPSEFSPEEMFNLKDSQRDSTLLSNRINKLYSIYLIPKTICYILL